MKEHEKENALAWYKKHERHVKKLINVAVISYPSSEDIGRPELWKPENWKWFEDNFI